MARESIHSKINRVRPPRVQLSYDVYLGDKIEKKEIPFVVAVLADLTGQPAEPLPRIKDRKFIEINRDNFNNVLAALKPRLQLTVDNSISGNDKAITIELQFRHIEDFEPAQVVEQVLPLRELLLRRQQLGSLLAKIDINDRLSERLQEIRTSRELMQQILVEASREKTEGSSEINLEIQLGTQTTKSTKTASAIETHHPPSLIERVITEAQISKDEKQRQPSRREITALVEEVMKAPLLVDADLDVAINTRIAEIDDLLSQQLSTLMHATEFQRLEATWRGLNYLVSQTETSSMLKIRVFNVSKDELRKDLEKAVEFNQSALFKQVYEEQYGTFDGTPFGALIGDYEFGRSSQDISFLEKISNIAASAHAPFIAAASPALFDLDSFTELSTSRDLAKIFDTVEYVRWKSFRESEDSRFVGLTLPHILMRLPYGPRSMPVEVFNFIEDVDDHSKYLWGNAAYAFGTCLTNAFAKYAWCAAIRGVEGGGLVEGLPAFTFLTDSGEVALKCPTEIAITDRREKELSDLGFVPLLHYKGTDYAVFFSAQSCQEPKKYNQDLANANARLSTQLQCVFTTARFAHYLKDMMRNQIGVFMTRSNCEDFLNRWISNYVLADDGASPMIKATFPLREARIDVAEVMGKPGVYQARMFIRPHFQLDELSVSLRLVVELPTRPWH